MFGWLRKRPRLVRLSDQVYSSRAQADLVLGQRVQQREAPTFICSFYPASLRRIAEALAEQGVAVPAMSSRARPSLPLGSGNDLWLLDAGQLTRDLGLADWLVRAGAELQFLFVEHYGSLTAETAVLDVLEEASAVHPQRVQFFVGLDEPLMAAFNGEFIVRLMQRMGMPLDEAIEHPGIDKAIVRAQQKLQKHVTSFQPADSDAEWFRLNGHGD